ncbi:MAG TPA: redoxin family protein, partial [Planctomycetia bacterium]|nr:redoxin family protein [Planctomycetia bacterium]
VLYHNGTIVTEAAGQALWLRAAEVVKVGDVWKLTGVPVIVDEKKPVETVGVLVPAISSQSAPTDIAGDSPVEASEEIQTLVAQLQKHDEAMPKDADAKTMVNYHRARHDLCAQIGKASKKLPNREHWYRQAADSIDAAVQTKAYPEGVEALEQYSEAFGKTSWGKKLSAYFKYRAINASFALRVDKEEHAKAQEKYVAELTEFVKAHPDSDDAADALWQLGNGMEFANKDGEALAHYKRLAKDHPKSQFAKKAEGAVRRIEAVGQQARWVGTGAGGYDLDTAQLRGKVVLVHYWATWCEPCKQEMGKIAALREKFGSKGLEVVGICLDSNVEGATAFIKQARLEWPQLLEKGALDGELAVQYGVISLPTMMLVDEDGRVLHRNLQANTLDVEVEKALAKKIATKDK